MQRKKFFHFVFHSQIRSLCLTYNWEAWNASVLLKIRRIRIRFARTNVRICSSRWLPWMLVSATQFPRDEIVRRYRDRNGDAWIMTEYKPYTALEYRPAMNSRSFFVCYLTVSLGATHCFSYSALCRRGYKKNEITKRLVFLLKTVICDLFPSDHGYVITHEYVRA